MWIKRGLWNRWINPDKPRIFGGSFIWGEGGVNLSLTKKKFWHHLLDTAVITFFIRRKYQKIWKINYGSSYGRKKSSYFLIDLRNLYEFFQTNVLYANIKSHEKQCFTLFLENRFSGKPQVKSNCSPPSSPSLYRVKVFEVTKNVPNLIILTGVKYQGFLVN